LELRLLRRGYVCEFARLGGAEGSAGAVGVVGPRLSVCDRKEEGRVYVEIRGPAPSLCCRGRVEVDRKAACGREQSAPCLKRAG
jgi:hypothetical protein